LRLGSAAPNKIPFTSSRRERRNFHPRLGLSIVAAIAEMHGGKLELHAPARGGFGVVIELPLALPAAAGAPGVRVLVVEDTRSLADGIAEGLKDHGMAVDVAYEARDAAAKLDVNGLRRRRPRP
jgi:hypothetical protein